MFVAVTVRRLTLCDAAERVGEFAKGSTLPATRLRRCDEVTGHIPIGEGDSMQFGDQFTEGALGLIYRMCEIAKPLGAAFARPLAALGCVYTWGLWTIFWCRQPPSGVS